jgi:hypothetical protein
VPAHSVGRWCSRHLVSVPTPRRRPDGDIHALAEFARFVLIMHMMHVHAAKQPRSDLEMGPVDRLGSSSGVRGRRPQQQQQQPAGGAAAPAVLWPLLAGMLSALQLTSTD